jgi:dephospho-CoA kinase
MIQPLGKSFTFQFIDEIKIKKATYVINNDSTLLKLEEDFNRLLPEFLNIYSQKNKTILKKNF